MYVPPVDYAAEIQPTVTKTASFNGDAFDLGAGYAPGGLGRLHAAVVEVAALDKTTGDETYTFKLQESADGANGWTDIGVGAAASAAGTVIVKGVSTTRYLRLVLTAAGTTPSITYDARLGL
jgi:hypothetical protein